MAEADEFSMKSSKAAMTAEAAGLIKEKEQLEFIISSDPLPVRVSAGTVRKANRQICRNLNPAAPDLFFRASSYGTLRSGNTAACENFLKRRLVNFPKKVARKGRANQAFPFRVGESAKS
jgi:hypothetical protein